MNEPVYSKEPREGELQQSAVRHVELAEFPRLVAWAKERGLMSVRPQPPIPHVLDKNPRKEKP